MIQNKLPLKLLLIARTLVTLPTKTQTTTISTSNIFTTNTTDLITVSWSGQKLLVSLQYPGLVSKLVQLLPMVPHLGPVLVQEAQHVLPQVLRHVGKI